jgi:putative amide transporter protein
VSLVVAIISAIYMIIFYVGGTTIDNKILVARSDYFAFACLGYTVLTVEVWLNSYGKLRASILAWSLILWTPIGLWIPAFMLMTKGALPF